MRTWNMTRNAPQNLAPDVRGKGTEASTSGLNPYGNSPRGFEAADVGIKEGPKEGSRLAGLREQRGKVAIKW